MSSPKFQRALISTSDKTHLAEFARGLAVLGVEIYSSGGTRAHLAEHGIAAHEVSDYTGFPEMLSGRLKTLHPKVHGGILARRDLPEDMQALDSQGIVPFELVVVNLYPFEQTIARADTSFEEAIEQIDIGGPTLIRAAAKNHAYVTIASSSEHYAAILEQVQETGSTTPELRRSLAGAAFEMTARYDRAIADYFGRLAPTESGEELPRSLSLSLTRKTELRYGENPHQPAAVYEAQSPRPGANLLRAKQLGGKELSYNNLLDADSALAMARGFAEPAAIVVKHNNPCGAAVAGELAVAVRRAFDGDPVSAFGSVVAVNRPLDVTTAEALAEPGRFVEVIVAPSYEPAALEVLKTKPKWKNNVRLLELGPLDVPADRFALRHIDGGLLLQATDTEPDPEDQWTVATRAQPGPALLPELRFAWAMCRHVKSNAIVLSRERALVGVGAGQMSRVDAVEIAIRKAGQRAGGSVLASDAFFPFDDSIHQAAAAGVAAFIQPGGSRGDESVVAACDKHNLPMIFTGRRHFKH